MYLSPAKAQVLGRVMQTLAEPHAEADVRQCVGTLLLDLLGADYYASYVWDESTHAFGGRVALNMSDLNLATYETYFQHRDPITPVMQQRREATLVVQVMPQKELVRTEFFNDFLYRDGLYWGVNLYAWDGEHNIGDMRIWRNRRRESFDQDTLDLLELIRPAFVAALRRARGAAPQAPRLQAAPPPAMLSEREREIVQLASLGYGDKAIAQRLGISFTTVRTHLGHAFRKLGVENRVQLVACMARQRSRRRPAARPLRRVRRVGPETTNADAPRLFAAGSTRSGTVGLRSWSKAINAAQPGRITATGSNARSRQSGVAGRCVALRSAACSRPCSRTAGIRSRRLNRGLAATSFSMRPSASS